MKKIREETFEEKVFYTIDFYSKEGNFCDYTFISDEDENPLFSEMTEGAKENYNLASNSPDYVRVFKEHSYIDKIPAVWQCDCGEKIELTPQYWGAYQCPRCGRWYNLWGQSLKDPSEWEEEEW